MNINRIEVFDWNDLAAKCNFSNLIIGNGASCAVWGKFNYTSLYEKAEGGLSQTAKTLFAELDTKNFEDVLRALYISAITIDSFEKQGIVDGAVRGHLTNEYDKLRTTLFETVGDVHLPYAPFQHRIDDFAAAMADYRRVFSLNYDLLPYWSFQKDRIEPWVKEKRNVAKALCTDFFGRPDGEDLVFRVSGGMKHIELYYLHGGIHLWTDALTGVVGKLENTGSKNILELLLKGGGGVKRRKIPLFISEGSSTQKLQAIRNSGYLNFCYESLKKHSGEATVVFGTELGDVDEHIATALIKDTGKPVAFSVYDWEGTQESLYLQAEKIRSRLPKELVTSRRVLFFDSQTHPLGQIKPCVPLPVPSLKPAAKSTCQP